MSEEAGPEESLPADLPLAVSNLTVQDDDQSVPTVVPEKNEKTKIDILLKATGNAPIMKKKKWTVTPDKHVGWIMDFVKKYLKLEPEEQLFLYVNQTFAPSPDQIVRNLYECFGTDGRLVLHYCKSQAWG